MTRLTDTQLVVLAAAAQRPDGAIFPLPKTIRGGAAARVIDGLVRRGLAERVPEGEPISPEARGPKGRAFRITRAGLEAIGVDPAEDPDAPSVAPGAPDTGAASGATPTTPAGAEEAATGAPVADTGAAGRAEPRRARRAGTKRALLIDLLHRPEGATIDEIAAATGWQRHTVRGAISGALKKKLGLTVTSEKVENRGRVYRIADAD